FDPTGMGGGGRDAAWARKRAECEYRRMLGEIEKAEARAAAQGWQRMPPRHSHAELERLGRRLYRRVVLGLKYHEIADREQKAVAANPEVYPNAKTPTEENVRRTVESWARDLGIPLRRRCSATSGR